VNHQVEHDADIDRAAGLGREPVHLDEPRLGQHLVEVAHHRVEPLDVADLQDAFVFPRQRDEFFGSRDVVGDRFLDKHVFAALQKHAPTETHQAVGVAMLAASTKLASSSGVSNVPPPYFSVSARTLSRSVSNTPMKLHTCGARLAISEYSRA